MKKVILMTACIAAMLLSGCSDNELASVGDGIGTSTQSAIGFHVVGNQAETRANIINAGNITSTDFNVIAFTRNEKDGSDVNFFMGENKVNSMDQTGVKIDHKQGKWDYTNPSDLHYWPGSTHLNFYAVSPGSLTDTEIETELNNAGAVVAPTWDIKNTTKTISYSTVDEYAERNTSGLQNKDVMYAIARNQTYTKDNGGTVKFTFKHILSQVVFKAKTEFDNMEVNIKEIKIHNFGHGSTYTLPTTSDSEGTWAKPTPTKGAYTVVTGQNITVDSKDNATEISVKGPMLFVPQALNPWKPDVAETKTKAQADDAVQSYLEITCKIKQNDELVFKSDTEYVTLYVPFKATWEQGKRYIYTLIFGGGYDENGNPILHPIKCEGEAEDWPTPTESNVDL